MFSHSILGSSSPTEISSVAQLRSGAADGLYVIRGGAGAARRARTAAHYLALAGNAARAAACFGASFAALLTSFETRAADINALLALRGCDRATLSNVDLSLSDLEAKVAAVRSSIVEEAALIEEARSLQLAAAAQADTSTC